MVSDDDRSVITSARRDARIAGLIATALAGAFLWLISGFFSGIPFAPTSVADAAVRVLPGTIETFFIELLRHWAQRLFEIGVIVGSLVFGAEVLARTLVFANGSARARAGVAGAVIGLAAFGGAMVDPSSDPNPVVVAGVTLLALAIYTFAASGLFSSMNGARAEADANRRQVLRLAVAGGGVLALGGGLLGWVARRVAGPNTDVPIVAPSRPARIPSRAPFPDIPGLSPEITSAADHYVVDIDIVPPSVEASAWSLRVHGLIDNPARYGFQQLQHSFDVVDEYAVLTCISNRVGGSLIGNSKWGGVRLKDVLASAGVQDGAVDVVFRAADGYEDSIPIDVAMDPTTLLAVSQNDKPLTQEHGFPCRIRVPKIYGMKNVKWITEIEVVDSDFLGFWQSRGWNDRAIVHTESRIDVAGDNLNASVGDATWIAGVAWAGDRGISKVEVSTDGGRTWNEALLKDPLSPLSWRLWAHRWTPTTQGPARVECRATDGTGALQTTHKATPYPSGASGLNVVEVTVT
ncbi:MAG: molybdopterin-dependent oxidoreductase [Actinomycetota bacterium]|nr:molybdopterin-dependent oxidoreductase [Actinomycetota bacterium]